jgi:CRP/FNR family cyclic AMP-dependent transcriptional regulator
MRLLDLDPELGAGLDGDALARARKQAVVPVLRLERGIWDPVDAGRHPSLRGQPLCLLLARGVLMCSTAIGARATSTIAGPGDVVPIPAVEYSALASRRVIVVAEPAIVAVIDTRFMALACRWPELTGEILRRLADQLQRAGVEQAIGHLSRTEDRVLAFAWHISERFGRVGSEGVSLGVRLTHETIGKLVGAERPTVTLAIATLERDGLLRRREKGVIQLPHGSAERLATYSEIAIDMPKARMRVPESSEANPRAAVARAPLAAPLDIAPVLTRARSAHELAAHTVQRSRRLCASAEQMCSRSRDAMRALAGARAVRA